MAKILSISIAAYNVEKYLDKAINSCIDENCIDFVEVLVVNDGSKDSTREIARKYETKYPESIRLIDKENGGYGTTVNLALREAKGKYFRLLDGDDWLEDRSISKYVELLKKTDTDIVITGVNYFYEATGNQKLREVPWAKLEGETYNLSSEKMKQAFSMWHMAVKTNKLKNFWNDLPEHTLYTDQLFVYYSLLCAESIQIETFPVYCYRIGREGQSADIVNRKSRWYDICRVYEIMLDDYVRRMNISRAVDKRLEVLYALVIRTLLLLEPDSKWRAKIIDYEKRQKRTCKKLYNGMWWRYKRITILRLTRYKAYRFICGEEASYNNTLY